MIEVKNLTKMYGDFKAVDDLSFTVKEHEIYGFLGPNGAGKSTTMNILCGCLSFSSGEVKIDGFDIFENAKEAKQRIGYLPEIPPLYLDDTPYEYLKFVAKTKHIKREDMEEEIAYVMEETQIEDVKDKLIKYLSKGYRQRVGIAQALLGKPKVIILDEPTVGLDPKQIIEIREMIKDLGTKHTILLSSHILSEVQEICDTIMIISKGKLVACDTSENLANYFAGSIVFKIISEADVETVSEIVDSLENVKTCKIEKDIQGSKLEIEFVDSDEKEIARKLYFAFAQKEKAIFEMQHVKASLEDVFIELTSKKEEEVNHESNI